MDDDDDVDDRPFTMRNPMDFVKSSSNPEVTLQLHPLSFNLKIFCPQEKKRKERKQN
jgi:hypothetical protein